MFRTGKFKLNLDLGKMEKAGVAVGMRPKIEIVRVSSSERKNFRPLDGVQLRATYSHMIVGTYCPSEPSSMDTATSPSIQYCESKVSTPLETSRKYKRNLGPVSRLLKRRHQATSLATKSCDNIYSINKTSNYHDWKISQRTSDRGLQARESNSLDWRVGRTIECSSGNLDWVNSCQSAEQLCVNGTLTYGNLATPTTKSKIVSLLRRLSPRLPRPSSKGSLPSTPSICPWIQVEYSNMDFSERGKRDNDENLENDISFQREIKLNELRKKMAKSSSFSSSSSMHQSTFHPSGVKMAKGKKSPVSIMEARSQELDIHPAYENHIVGGEGGGGGGGRSDEVAGLEEAGSGNSTVTLLVDGRSPGRASRRTRPLSLAVQPLHYHRLDPEAPTRTAATAATAAAAPAIPAAVAAVILSHSKMTSQESIGNCSLDVDRSTSDRSDINVGSLSEKTLHSLNLSYNGEAQVSPKNAHQCISIEDTLQRPTEKSDVSNGYHGEAETDQLTTKKPSYLGLACSINGYSGITRYDSKLREGFRSRDSSPGARLITRDISPAGFRSNENLTVPVSHPPKSQSISPLAMDRHNGFSNGTKGNRKIDNYIETRSSTRDCQGYSEVDRGTSLLNAFPDLSPIRSSSPNKRTGFKVENYNHQNKTYTNISVSSPKKSAINVSNSSDTSLVNGSQVIDSQVFNSSSGSEKSFIQQRVERLYGPGALAQGFFFKRSSGKKLNLSDSFNKSSNNNNTSLDDSNTEESLKNLPVLRHLRPEFRAQLPVVSPRRPTDGSEQVIKPLQRLSVSAKKNDAKEIKVTHKKETSKEHESSNTSTNSISDQQPAAPKVVLPVLDNTTSKPGVGKEEYVEKNGHYFITLLKREISRLHSLAESAEAELEHTRPDELPEEAAGKLRSAAGKARLLASQKMQQFEGLCQKNINQIPGEDFPTTNEDLAGFWDMVMLQVDQVNELFEHIERLRKSNWVEVAGTEKIKTPQNGNASKRRTSGIPKAKPAATPSEASRKAREAREASRRQMLEERRRAMKANSKKSDSTVEIFVPET